MLAWGATFQSSSAFCWVCSPWEVFCYIAPLFSNLELCRIVRKIKQLVIHESTIEVVKMEMCSYVCHVYWKHWKYIQLQISICDSWVLFQEAIPWYIHSTSIYWAVAISQALSWYNELIGPGMIRSPTCFNFLLMVRGLICTDDKCNVNNKQKQIVRKMGKLR